MNELAELLELMHTATTRWRTLRAAGREWRHVARLEQAWERAFSTGHGRTAAKVMASYGDLDPEPQPFETDEPWRLWLAKPDRARAEFVVGNETVTVAIAGTTRWSWSPSQPVTSNDGDPNQETGTGPGEALVDPAFVLPVVELAVIGRSAFLGRPVLEVVATPSPIDEDDEEAGDWHAAVGGLGGGADAYRLLVDAERGILLRAEALLGGAPFRVLELEEVAFDEPLPEDTFAPPGAAAVERLPAPRRASLADLPGEVPFVVLVPEHPPFGPPHVMIQPANRRFELPAQVHLHYLSPMPGEEQRHFFVVESPAPIPERTHVDWREEGGVQLGEDTRYHPPLRLARVERAGTHVEIQSASLTLEQLRDLAGSLVPLR